jgi:hypothetical protein
VAGLGLTGADLKLVPMAVAIAVAD